MKILVLDEWLPSKCDSGKTIRTFELLALLAQKHQITYLAHQDYSDRLDDVRKMEQAGFEVVCVPRRKKYASPLTVLLGAVPALFRSVPISVDRHFSADYLEAMQKLIAERSFDLMHVEWSHYAVYGRYVPQLPQFVCTHNVEYLSWSRFARISRNPFKKLLGYHEAWKMRNFERDSYRKADYVSVVSEDDAKLLRDEFGMSEFCIIQNGVGISQYDEIPNTARPDHLVYCGSMDAFINQDAVAWFLSDIFPLILKKKPEATFTVIGRNPPQSLLDLQNDRIRFTGKIDDIRKPLKEAMLEVVPLRIGGGSRLKILEAFAAKLPVLSTTMGAEGLEIQDGKQIVLADDPQTFADRCVELLDNETRRNGLIENGRRLVDEHYDWSRIYPLVEQAWVKTVELAKKR